MPTSPHIIWDWNGTLLDDIDLSLSTINKMLKKRTLDTLTKERYREIFTFPVKDYYVKAGFDFEKEEWNDMAHEFIYQFLAEVNQCNLTASSLETLSFFSSLGCKQAIISAMQHTELVKSVSHLNIFHFFEHIGGIDDHLAGGKVENALNYLHKNSINPENTFLFGDTLHDAEVANELGCKCILVATGHQSFERLLTSGFPVVMSLKEIPSYFNLENL